ncbi:GyrI-like domain-containing protein [uncultured Zobellia sp.]|uniref:AraC family transcriptional regulator n=1 Tax=uncultured Zobellia sp. TaxID=255433 RepID=UPI00259429EE|nr:GyrI-like domain-containing protein [uncultured Zobellia sp.]
MKIYTREASLKEYFFRINKAIDYIKLNLEEELSLEKVASIANFSKYHFHRVFKAITGSTLNSFIKHARIERAVFYLVNNPNISISEISAKSGFKNTNSFSRSFKEIYKTTPSDWKQSSLNKNSNIRIVDSKIDCLEKRLQDYLANKIYNTKNTSVEQEYAIDIQIKDLEELNVAYVRNLNVHMHDSETFGKMFETLMQWAIPRGLANFPETKALTVYRSNPNPSGIIQADVCLTVPVNIEGDGIIGRTTISGGQYAVVHKEATMEDCFKTWDYIFDIWFPNNGYQPDARNFYINHLNDAKARPEGLFIFDMCIPVKPL